MDSLDARDQERVDISYQEGTKEFTKEDLNNLFKQEKKVRSKAKNLGELWSDFSTLWELLKDYKNGSYTHVPWRFIAAVGFAVVYLINPFDVIPDVIALVGYIDDISLFSIVLASFKAEIAAYKEWKNSK